jgi:hypothetical protein
VACITVGEKLQKVLIQMSLNDHKKSERPFYLKGIDKLLFTSNVIRNKEHVQPRQKKQNIFPKNSIIESSIHDVRTSAIHR